MASSLSLEERDRKFQETLSVIRKAQMEPILRRALKTLTPQDIRELRQEYPKECDHANGSNYISFYHTYPPH